MGSILQCAGSVRGNAGLRRPVRWLVLVGLAATLGGCLGYDGEVQRGYVVDAYTLGQLKPGTPAQTVLSDLGTPSTTSTVGGDAWYYISQKVNRSLAFSPPEVTDQHIVAVYFDKDKKVQRVANYGLEDGHVVDMVSRTTPTGGAEQGFLKNLFRSLLRFS